MFSLPSALHDALDGVVPIDMANTELSSFHMTVKTCEPTGVDALGEGVLFEP